MRSRVVAGVALLAASGALAQAPAAADASAGKRLFEEKCAMCHRANGMGTGLLARRMDRSVAELEQRRDLTAGYVERAVRIGVMNMPAITRGEVSDAQLARIAAYLAHTEP